MRTWIWIDPQSVLAANIKLVRGFGGRAGIRDESLLDSALTRPKNLCAYGDPDICDLATAYLFGIVQNHPFIDGNKRTAVMSMLIFLTINDYVCEAGDVEIYASVMALAQKDINEADFAAWLKTQVKEIEKK